MDPIDHGSWIKEPKSMKDKNDQLFHLMIRKFVKVIKTKT